MKINASSELMKNQKHAVVMAPASQFEVLQTQQGHSLFFSIGTDGVFYCTREVTANTQGWTKIDLSTSLSKDFSGATVKAKTFDVSQNLAAGTVDLALVITVNNSDYLFLALGSPDTDAGWDGIAWTAMPFDDKTHPFTGLAMADIYIAQSGTTEYIVADILKDPASPVKSVYRYFIDPSKQLTGSVWNPHDLSGNLESDKISNSLGRKSGQAVDGIYTMGSIANIPELIYTPLYNPFNIHVPPSPTRLGLPAGATAFALSVNSQKCTDLFVAAGGSLYFLSSSQQTDGAQPVLMYTHPLLNGVQHLVVNSTASKVVVWGLNLQGEVFYLTCAAGSEASTAAWSCPVPILNNVIKVASFLNTLANNSVIFAHMQDDSLVQLTQDPVTTLWQQRSIVLPPTDVNDMIEFSTYSTHIQLNDDYNRPLANATVAMTATSPCSVYINNEYHVLATDVPLQITTEATGIVTIIQEVDSLGCVCYHLSADGQNVSVNPMTAIIGKLQNVQQGSDLDVTVTDEKGTSKPLLDPSITDQQKADTAQAIQQFVQIGATMPPDGSLKTSQPQLTSRMAFQPARDKIFGVSFANNSVHYYNGVAQMASLGLTLHDGAFALQRTNVQLDNVGDAIDATAGDIFLWINNAIDQVDHFFVQVIGEVTHFFIQIADKLYHFILNCVNDVIQAVQFVLEKIKVAIEDFIEWLGFIFGWNDIVRTHQVVKNILIQYARQCIGNIGTYKTNVQQAFGDLEKNINNWAGLPTINETWNSLSSSASPLPGQNSPQTHWGFYQTQTNVPNAKSSYTPVVSTPGSTIQQILNDLLSMVEREGDVLNQTIEQVKQLIDDAPALTITDILKRLIAILADTLLSTAENIITTVMDVIAALLEGALDALDAPIEIPVISSIYKDITGDDLSVLDLVCLVVSIPVTIIYKMAKNAPPFPDDSVSSALINAPDFSAIRSLCTASTSRPMQAAVHGQSPAAKPELGGPLPSELSVSDKLVFSGNCLAFGGAILQAIFVPLKLKFGSVPILSPILSAGSAISYLPYVAPDIMDAVLPGQEVSWYTGMNELCADIGILKAFVDITTSKKGFSFGEAWGEISPWLDFALNIVWQVPTTAAIWPPANPDKNDWLNFAGGTLFDAGGILSPLISNDFDPVTLAAAVVAETVCNLGYGSLMLAQSAALLSSPVG